MANLDKNIVITPNVGQAGDPSIVFSGADASTAAQNITIKAYPTNSGTLSVEGSAGQLFSITNSLSGTIFSVNDVSGIPSIEVLDTGLIKFGQYSGNILLGTGTDNGSKLQINGTVSSAGLITGTYNGGSQGWTNWVIKASPAAGGAYIAADRASAAAGEVGFVWAQGGAPQWINYLGTSGTTLQWFQGSVIAQTLDTSGNLITTGSMRSPIFYDSNNTGYYIDPTAASNLGGPLKITGNGSYVGNQGYSTLILQDTSGYPGLNFRSGNSNWLFRMDGGGSQLSWHYSSDSSAQGTGTFTEYVKLNTDYLYHASDIRTPIFYDSDNTAYYIDPTSITSIRTAGDWRSDSSGWTGEFSGKIQYHANNWYFQSADQWFFRNSGGSNVFYVNQSGHTYAPILYDSNNTGYYTDPASTTNLNALTVNGTALCKGAIGSTGTYGIVVNSGDNWNGVGWGSTNNKSCILHYGGGNDYALRFGRYGNNFGAFEDNPFYFYMNNGYATASNSWRAPIFYDSDNTGYYIDPNSTGTSAYLAGTLYVGMGVNNSYIYMGDTDEGNRIIHCNSNRIGFLTSGGAWGSFCDDAGWWQSDSSVRAPIFYDSNDTYYYNDPNSSRRFAGRTYIHEWIEFVNYTGLYSQNNEAYFRPNEGTYGGWRCDGTRNGWQGIEFVTHTTLMMNDDTYGFHKQGTGWRFYVTGGSGYFPGNVTAYWSDRRLKENLRPIGKEATDILSQLTTYRFNWNKKVKEFNLPIEVGKEEIGLIAQDVQKVLPDAVVVNKSANTLNEDGTTNEKDYLTINWDKITPLLVQSLNDTIKELNELKQKLKDNGII